MNTNDEIPESLRAQIATERDELQRVVKLRNGVAAELASLTETHKASTDQPRKRKEVWAAIKAKRKELRDFDGPLTKIKNGLAALVQECHKYEPTVSQRSNAAGDPIHLRMPVSRSGCYSHAVALPRQDDQ